MHSVPDPRKKKVTDKHTGVVKSVCVIILQSYTGTPFGHAAIFTLRVSAICH